MNKIIAPVSGNGYQYGVIDVETWEIEGYTNDPREVQFTGLRKDDKGHYTIPLLDKPYSMPIGVLNRTILTTQYALSVLCDTEQTCFWAFSGAEPCAQGFALTVIDPRHIFFDYADRCGENPTFAESDYGKGFRRYFKLDWLNYQFVVLHEYDVAKEKERRDALR